MPLALILAPDDCPAEHSGDRQQLPVRRSTASGAADPGASGGRAEYWPAPTPRTRRGRRLLRQDACRQSEPAGTSTLPPPEAAFHPDPERPPGTCEPTA